MDLQQADIAEAARPVSEQDWVRVLARYSQPSATRSALEIVVTLVPLAILWFAAWWSLSVSYLLTLLFTVPAAGLVVRLFLIQHDCGHGAFFENRKLNDWVGRLLGVFTLTPYDVWRRSHAIHHASSGNLDRRGIGDLDTLTVGEYQALPPFRQFAYRVYRHPIMMFGIGPAYLFLFEHRIPKGQMTKKGWMPWLSTMGTNLGIALLSAGMIALVGAPAFFLIHLPIVTLAASMGVWLFYVQHQFEETYWAPGGAWSLKEAALHGSSHYDLPRPLRWITANIGVHHVHHLVSRIPFYRLPQVLRDYPELVSIGRITIPESFRLVKLKLWDENAQRLVSFREARV